MGLKDLFKNAVRKGPSPEERARLNNSLFMLLGNKDHDDNDLGDVVALLEGGADPEARDRDNNTPLIYAAQNGHMQIVDHFLSLGVDLTAQNNQGRNALLAALREHHEDVGIQLITAGVPVNVRDKFQFTPIYAAVQDGRDNVVKLLIAAGAEVNTQHTDGITPLGWAVALGHEKVFDVLLAAKADPNIASTDGMTPLIRAVGLFRKSMIDKLFDAGADIYAVDKTGKDIFDFARMQGDQDRIDYIEKKFAAHEKKSYAPIREGTQRAVKTLKTISFKNRNTPLSS